MDTETPGREAMTAEAIAELRRLEAEAEEAPWEAFAEKYDYYVETPRGTDAKFFETRGNDMLNPGKGFANINLVVAMRNALPALLDELERLRAENARLQNDLCQVHTVNPCDGGCGRLFRMREVEIWDGKRLCVHCLKAEAERLMAAMPGVSAYDPHAVAGAEFGVGEKQP